MAYTYVRAKGLLLTLDARWHDVDDSVIANTDLRVLARTYQQIYFTITHPALPLGPGDVPGEAYLTLTDLMGVVGSYLGTMTLIQYLGFNLNQTLPTVSTAPDFDEYKARFADAWLAGYTIEPTDHTRSPDAEIPRSEKVDLLLTHSKFSTQANLNKFLVTVNGLLHRTGGSVHGVYIHKGGETGLIANDNRVGIYSFANVANLTTYPINSLMVHKADNTVGYQYHAYIESPVSLEGKSVMLSIGGFLHVPDDSFTVIGDNTIAVHFTNYPIVERLFLLQKRINIESLGLEATLANPSQFALSDLEGDEVFLGLLTLPQSFIIVVDTPELYVRKHQVEHTELPGRFAVTYPTKRLPLIGPYGHFNEYIVQYDDFEHVLTTAPVNLEDHNYASGAWRDELSVDPSRNRLHPFKNGQGFFLEVGRRGSV